MKKRLLLVLLLMATLLSACAPAAPAFEVGEELTLSEGQLANPRNWGGPYWLNQQLDNCMLHDYAVVIYVKTSDDESHAKVSQEIPNLGICIAWVPIDDVAKK
ncbi:MAG: hypothetical protein HN846_04690 [Candidatus Pacebacteria bacterium]|jgi:hypothetical protein|nr:hypothetical protein [Candidatus Paceibacterota bacterium]MBT3512074.1 hypothetical protein [Candidatus Paceibacterota bacterium]MBT4005202.1 hypothetical protein [Candidatus Paceibacterota bacterium]MBT4358634.1 hypothetical protein [Candidatus Paceibacterota bacterium]MBT4680661.1 hypothetical protein [Candidatus Paceibacterota bacterium]